MDATFSVRDGQHWIAAIEAILAANAKLGSETISVMLIADVGLKHCRQVFADLARYSVRTSASLVLLDNQRDEAAQLAKSVMSAVPLFAELTETEKSSISNRSTKLFTLMREQAAALETEHDGAMTMVRQAKRRFEARGGEYWEERESRLARRGEVQNQEKTIEGQLTALAGGGLPLALLPDLLGRVAEQDECERTAGQARSLLELLAERDRELLQGIKTAGVPAKAVATVREVQDADRGRREAAASHVETAGAIRCGPRWLAAPATTRIAGGHCGSRPAAGPTGRRAAGTGKPRSGNPRGAGRRLDPGRCRAISPGD